MGPTSSSLGLGDVALVWDNVLGAADVSIVDGDLGVDAGLTTAVILSLFCDRRADADDEPPSGDPTDRRGYWADEFAEVAGDRWGSRLWLLDRAKNTREFQLRSVEYAKEALAWMVEDKVVSEVSVTIETSRDRWLLTVSLQRHRGSSVSLRFAHVLDHQE